MRRLPDRTCTVRDLVACDEVFLERMMRMIGELLRNFAAPSM
jgi:hypothetical protein